MTSQVNVTIYPTSTHRWVKYWPNIGFNNGRILANSIGPMLELQIDTAVVQYEQKVGANTCPRLSHLCQNLSQHITDIPPSSLPGLSQRTTNIQSMYCQDPAYMSPVWSVSFMLTSGCSTLHIIWLQVHSTVATIHWQQLTRKNMEYFVSMDTNNLIVLAFVT